MKNGAMHGNENRTGLANLTGIRWQFNLFSTITHYVAHLTHTINFATSAYAGT